MSGSKVRRLPCFRHCIISTAVAMVVELTLGTPEIPKVIMTSPAAPGATHRRTNICIYADEVAHARIWAGFHYRFSVSWAGDGPKDWRVCREQRHAAR